MNFKRIISLSLVVIMLVLSLASCNLQEIFGGIFGSTTTTTPDDTTTTTTTTTTTSTADPELDPDPDEDDWAELYDIITVAEALEIAKSATTPTDAIYYVRGTVVTITSPDYGAMIINDGTGEISVYNTKGEDKSTIFPSLTEKPVKGDEVLLLCSLQNFNGTLEVEQAYLIDFKKGKAPDSSEYTEMTVSEAREAVEGTKIKLTGVVAQIVYAYGPKPCGIYLIDGTDSIYVYDGDIAGQVSVGNTITVIGSRAYWLQEKEIANAEKFGYKGCCQLADASLVENDNKTNTIDFSWCEEKTVKEILETPVTSNITTTIYKTTALVTKVDDGTGFVNYYFNDLDGKTGSYTYTQCNGSDFAWLDEFDGKICTVYLSVINAKSTNTGCIWRFQPILVKDEGFVFDTSKAPEHAVKYYGIGQFLDEYTGDPATELISSVSSNMLGFANVMLSYSSDNESVAFFTTSDGVTTFHCKNVGEATITVTATAEDNTCYSETVKIKVVASESYDYISTKDAADAQVGDIVIVKGIVGPSIANKASGFYLIDETGVIAVLLNTTDELKALEIGQEVIITGKRDRFHNGNGTHAGQTCITSASVLVNNYGDYEYSTDSFVTGITPEEFYDLDKTVDYSTTVFVFTATITKSTGYSVNYKLCGTNSDKAVNLYSGNAAQYAWLEQFVGQTVTVEVAACNWNNKNYWRGCVLSITTEDGQVFNEYNFLAE